MAPPGRARRRLSALRLRSFLLTSGTLSPLDTFAAELQLPFPMRLENPHVIADSQARPRGRAHGLRWALGSAL